MRAFTITARLLSQVKAAEILHRSPSAISQQIAKLEKMLGVSLFSRAGRILSLTPEGSLLLGYCIDLDLLFNKMFELQNLQGSGQDTLRIVLTRSVEIYLPSVLKIMEKEPGLNVDIRIATYETALSQIRAGSVHAGLVLERATPEDMEFLPVFPMHFSLCSLRGGKHPLPEQLSPQSLAALPLCMGSRDLHASFLSRCFRLTHGLDLNVAWPVSSLYTAHSYLLQDFGYVVTRNVGVLDDPRIDSLDLSKLIPPTNFGVICQVGASEQRNVSEFYLKLCENSATQADLNRYFVKLLEPLNLSTAEVEQPNPLVDSPALN